MPSITKISYADSNSEIFEHTYSQVCWNNCDTDSSYDVSGLHSGDAEVGDRIVVDWGMMEPNPSEIKLIEVERDGEEISKETLAAESSPLTI